MFHDADIQKWIEQHGVATSFTFMAYGKLAHDEVDLLIKGLLVQLADFDDTKMAVFFDEVTEEPSRCLEYLSGNINHLCFRR